MGDHFWPAVYPGLALGFLYGLSVRRQLSWLVGAVGGLFGAAGALLILQHVSGASEFVMVFAELGSALLMAALLCALREKLWRG